MKTIKFLSLVNVIKTYHEITALDSISFDIWEGEIFGYIGPNGAGKTTTIKILVGLIRDFQGDYHLKNVTLDRLHQELGYLPQGVSFQEWRTVDNVLSIFGKLSGKNEVFLKHQIEKILDLLELKDVRGRKVGKLSGGMIQKLGLAQALLNNPKFLVLDEPLSGLDPTSRFEMKQVIRRLSHEGTTVFFSSHILSDVQDIADRVAIIDKGRILKLGRTTELTTDLYPNFVYEVSFFSDFNDLAMFELKDIIRVEQPTANKVVLTIKRDADLRGLISELLKNLVQRNYDIQNINRITPNLDDVYLQYIKRGCSL
jgi:ABC-2 type transport system ATP-binding protein